MSQYFFIQILDLRSQQVRDTCILLTQLSAILTDDAGIKSFLRDTFDSILAALKAPNKVMSSYIDECIISIIRQTPFKSGLVSILNEVRESKSKHVRERCAVSTFYLFFYMRFDALSNFYELRSFNRITLVKF